ncbi:alpha-E domain-containing protein [Thalassoglobus sp. JC818]|uniref:alpha-E domain-containing protein n=1 Tax=Thalassoglobus sp. JC818 TaxID=3232136 RepID=UPI0034584767
MLSRVAEAIYWMARYVERAENLARFVDVTLNMTLDQPIGIQQQWEPLVLATGDEKYFHKNYKHASAETVMQFLVFDREYPNSILSSLRFARENARSVRESISSEMWEQLNAFYHRVKDAEPTFATMDSPSDFLCSVKEGSHLFNGIADATMSHDLGWHFANLGRVIERADKTSRLLDVKYFTLLPTVSDVGTPTDDLQWADVLRSVSGFQSYRRRYHGITVERIIGFLILDRTFPRAINYCVREADVSLHAISGTLMGTYRNSAERLFGQLRAELDYRQVENIREIGLHEYIDSLQVRLNEASAAIHDTFFAIRPVEEPWTGQFQSQR